METKSFSGKLKEKPNYVYSLSANREFQSLDLDKICNGKEKIKPNFHVQYAGNEGLVSFWVSAKRTRSYPYTRVYHTLSGQKPKTITIIPVVKDEGKDGDRDYIQWDTVSICSYLGIYVVLGYYVNARKNSTYSNKVTEQEFDYPYICEKIKEILKTCPKVKKWNDNQRKNIGELTTKIISGYKKISKETGVEFHNLDELKQKLFSRGDSDLFKQISQKNSMDAQHRETVTEQPKEQVFGLPKSKVTLSDHYGGLYSWTVDAYHRKDITIYLMEMKHAKTGKPKLDDAKDALLKFHFYGNIEDFRDNKDKKIIAKPVLVLSSGNLTKKQLEKCDEYDDLRLECEKNNIILVLAGKDTVKENIISEIES